MKYFTIALSFLMLISCHKDDTPKDYTAENDQEIQTYIAENNLTNTAIRTNSGLYYVIDEEGTGTAPTTSDIVKITYTSSYTNGTVYNKTTDKGIQLDLQKKNLLEGLVIGIPYFKKGGSGKLIIPSNLAYGNTDFGNIPAGSVMIFDIKLLDIYDDIEDANNAEITEYLADNDLTDLATKTDSGLYYIIDTKGTGAQPTDTSNVTVIYKGYFTNNTVFDDQSTSAGVSFDLGSTGLIKGWKEGIPYFNVGSKGQLIIPSNLAYGPDDYNNTIPGGSVLVFDIDLVSINNSENQ